MILNTTQELKIKGIEVKEGMIWVWLESTLCGSNFICFSDEQWSELEGKIILGKLKKEVANETN